MQNHPIHEDIHYIAYSTITHPDNTGILMTGRYLGIGNPGDTFLAGPDFYDTQQAFVVHFFRQYAEEVLLFLPVPRTLLSSMASTSQILFSMMRRPGQL